MMVDNLNQNLTIFTNVSHLIINYILRRINTYSKVALRCTLIYQNTCKGFTPSNVYISQSEEYEH